MRSCACDKASRLCVRTLRCILAFPPTPLLPSPRSATARAALFAGGDDAVGRWVADELRRHADAALRKQLRREAVERFKALKAPAGR